MAQRMTRLGTPRSISVANAILETVDPTALKRNVLLVLTFLAELVPSKDVIALDVESAITLWVFANVMMDTMETGANTRLFSVK